MDKKTFEEWLTKLGKAWTERDPYTSAALFAKNVIYYESVFEKPCANWDEVLKLWLVVPKNQKDVRFNFEVISVSEDVGIANWKVSRTLIPSNVKQKIDGIFLVSLNEDGLCTMFKQWRAVKEIQT